MADGSQVHPLSTYPFTTQPSVHSLTLPSIYLSMHHLLIQLPPICPLTHPPTHLATHQHIHLPIHLPTIYLLIRILPSHPFTTHTPVCPHIYLPIHYSSICPSLTQQRMHTTWSLSQSGVEGEKCGLRFALPLPDGSEIFDRVWLYFLICTVTGLLDYISRILYAICIDETQYVLMKVCDLIFFHGFHKFSFCIELFDTFLVNFLCSMK